MDGPSDYVDAAVEAWSRVFPDLDLGGYGIVLRLIRAGRIAEATLDQVTSNHGFEVRGDYEVLSALRRAHPTPLRPQDLADRVMISAPGITGRLDRLESAGYVNRAPHPTDRRATFIEITALGIGVVDGTLRSLADETDVLLNGFADSRRRRLTQELRELMLLLDDHPHDS